MLTVRDLMTAPVITLKDNEDLSLAEKVMTIGRLRHLPVVDAAGQLCGLVTHRDLLRAQASSLSASHTTERTQECSASSIMQREVESIPADAPAYEAALQMKAKKIGCLPVLDGDELVGIITEADFLDLAIRVLSKEPPRTHAAPPQ